MAYNRQVALTSNILAIQTAIQLRREHRKPTDYEKMLLGAYTGFGGLKCVLDTNPVEQWPAYDRILYPFVQNLWQLLVKEASSPMEAQAWKEGVKSSVLTAFYTDPYLIKKMGIGIAQAMGPDLKRFLDPSTGTGRFLHMFDEAGVQGLSMTAVEKDALSGLIAQALNPDADVRIEGLEQFPADRLGSYDLVATNIPFGQIQVFDPLFDKGDELHRLAQKKIHNYFFVKGLDTLREGGVLLFITSAGVLNSPSNAQIRRYLMDHANLIEALPLPTDCFKEESGIEVDTMFVVLQKNTYKKELTQREQWFIETQEVDYERVDQLIDQGAHYQGNNREVYRCPNRYVFERLCELVESPIQDQHYGMYPYVDTDQFGKPCIHYVDNTYDSMVGLDPNEESAYTQIIRLAMERYYDRSLMPVQEVEAVEVKNVLGGELLSLQELFGITADERTQVRSGARTKRSRIRKQPTAALPETQLAEQPIEVDPTEYGAHVCEGLIVAAQDRIGTLVLHSGRYLLQPMEISSGNEERFRGYAELRAAYWKLDDEERLMLMPQPELREGLNRAYDAFVDRFGSLHNGTNMATLALDPAWKEVWTLERMVDGRAEKADIFREPVAFHLDVPEVMTAEEALASSLNLYGRVNMDYMMSVTEKPFDQLRKELWEQVFWSGYDEWVTKEQLQRGNGYDEVDRLARYYADESLTDELTHSIEAVRAAIPKEIPFEEIGISMGERWIEPRIYADFARDWLKATGKMEVRYDEAIDQYAVSFSGVPSAMRELWSVGYSMDVTEIFVNALMDTYPQITMTVGYGRDKKVVVDVERTQMAATKITDVRNLFVEWVGKLPVAERDRLAAMYNRRYNGIMKPHFDGSFQTFPDLSLEQFNYKELYPSQKDAIWMIKQQQGGICDHEVGAGKTMIMCVAAHEMKRLGIVNKPLIIALKANVHDIADTYRRAYPDAKILYPGKDDFAPAKRQELFAQIKNNNWDCIILTHTQFQQIPQSADTENRLLSEELAAVEDSLRKTAGADYAITRMLQKRLEARKRSLEAKVNKTLHEIRSKRDDTIDFRDMGIDHIFVDESHHFKNLGFTSRHTRVAGLGNQAGSKQAFNLLLAIREIQHQKGGDLGATFLSGTTISNSLTELYNLFRYLRPEALARQQINSIDSWLAVYAKKSAEYEFSVTNTIIQKERFRQFVKVPELAAFYSEVTDYRTAEGIGIDRPKQNTVFFPIEPTAAQVDYTAKLVKFAETSDATLLGREPLNDNETAAKMLIATNYAKKMAIDMRLIDPEAYADERGSKVFVCAEKVGEYYRKFNEWKGTQFVFCDVGTYGSGKGFDLYSALKQLLVEEQGIPADEIRFIQQCSTEKAKKKLISDMNEGKLRVVVGSTQMLGTGVNAQERAVAVHHLDIPWRPSDLEQRNGRAVRKGNWVAKEHADNQVDVLIYATERTLDAYKFNLLQNKQQFINQLKQGEYGGRTMDEGAMEEDNGMSFAEYVAVLSGNNDLLEKAKLDKVINRLEKDKVVYNKETSQLERSLVYEEHQVVEYEALVRDMKADHECFMSAPKTAFISNEGEELSGVELGRYLKQFRGRTELGQTDKRMMGHMRGFEYYVDRNALGADYGIVGKVSGRHYQAMSSMPMAFEMIPEWLERQGTDLLYRSQQNENVLARKRQAVEDLKKLIPERQWPKEAELQEQKAKAAALDSKIKAALKEKEVVDVRLIEVSKPVLIEGEDGFAYIQAIVDGQKETSRIHQSLLYATSRNRLGDVARHSFLWYNPKYFTPDASEEQIEKYFRQYSEMPFTVEHEGQLLACDNSFVRGKKFGEGMFCGHVVGGKYVEIPLTYELKDKIKLRDDGFVKMDQIKNFRQRSY